MHTSAQRERLTHRCSDLRHTGGQIIAGGLKCVSLITSRANSRESMLTLPPPSSYTNTHTRLFLCWLVNVFIIIIIVRFSFFSTLLEKESQPASRITVDKFQQKHVVVSCEAVMDRCHLQDQGCVPDRNDQRSIYSSFLKPGCLWTLMSRGKTQNPEQQREQKQRKPTRPWTGAAERKGCPLFFLPNAGLAITMYIRAGHTLQNHMD